MKIALIIFILMSMAFAVYSGICRGEANEYKMLYIEKTEEHRKLLYEKRKLTMELNELRIREKQWKRLFPYNEDIPDGTLEAVRFAVIKSHPDNGGKEEDFIKYNECYRELKRRIGNG